MSERNGAEEGLQGRKTATSSDTPSSEGEENRGGRLGTIDRRQYLKLGAAAAAGAVGTVGFSGTSTAQSRGGVSFDRVVDAVDDLGMDPNGNSAIDSALDRAFGDGTLIEFPPGDYLVTRVHEFNGVNNVGIVGKTGDRSDVNFVFPDGYDERFLNVRFGQGWLFGDFTLRQTSDKATGVGLSFGPDRDATVRNVEISGFNPRNKQRGMEFIVYDSDGEATLDRYVRTGGSAVGDYPTGTQALLVPIDHEGTLYIKDPQIENAGENGIYASRSPGDVRIEGGYFANNDIASVRIAGEGSYIKDATFVIDTNGADKTGNFFNTRALWLESGSQGYLGGLVENCDFTIRNSPNCDGAIRVQTTAGDVTIRNCRIHNETRFASIYAEEPARISGDGPVTIENCSITGGSSNPRRGAIEIEERDGSTISECCISMDGVDHGVVIRNASGCTVRRSTIDVNGQTIFTPGSTVASSSISNSGSCPLPSDGGSGAGGNTGGSGGDDASDDGGSDDGDDAGADDTEDESSNDGSDDSGSSDETETPTEDDADDAGDDSEDSGSENGSDDSTETPTEDGADDSTEGTESGDGESSEGSSDDSEEGDSEESDSDDSRGDSDGLTGETRTLKVASDSTSPYEFSVSGGVEFDPGYGTEDRIDGNTVRGVLAGGTDAYRFTGDISSFTIDGDATVTLDGQQVDAASIGGGSSSDGANDSEETTTETETTETETDSESTETESSETSDDSSGETTETESDDSTDSSSESDSTESEPTETTETETESPEESDEDASDDSPASGGDTSGGTDSLANVIVLQSEEKAPYDLEVSGDIAYLPGYGRDDDVGGSSANGALAGGADAYLFSGLVTAFDCDGDLSVTVNGESVSADSVVGSGYDGAGDGQSGSKVLSLVGSGDASNYSFAVEGSTERVPAYGSDDRIDGKVVRGALYGGRDDYRIDGDVLWFDIEGDAEVRIDGEPVDPSNLPQKA